MGSAFQIDKKIVRTEIGVLLRLSHPNIVSMRPRCPHPSTVLVKPSPHDLHPDPSVPYGTAQPRSAPSPPFPSR